MPPPSRSAGASSPVFELLRHAPLRPGGGFARDRSPEASEQINARLILLLANQVGDQHILEQALAIAGQINSELFHDN